MNVRIGVVAFLFSLALGPTVYARKPVDSEADLDVGKAIEKTQGSVERDELQEGRPVIHIKLRDKGITVELLRKIATTCEKLQSLDLSYCDNLTDEHLKIVAKCEHLQSLKLKSCSQISDAGLLALNDLKELNKLD